MKGGGVTIPKDFTLHFGGTSGPTIQVDSDLDNIHIKEVVPITVNSNVAVTDMPRFEIGVKEFPVVTVNSNVAVKEMPVLKSELSIKEIPPITSNVNVAVKEVPELRFHYPAHYQVGFSLFGIPIWSVSLCGESQAINEKYVPRKTEECR